MGCLQAEMRGCPTIIHNYITCAWPRLIFQPIPAGRQALSERSNASALRNCVFGVDRPN